MQDGLIKRNSSRYTFLFHEEWAKVLDDFNTTDYAQMTKAIINYALYVNYIPEFSNPVLAGVWLFIKRRIDEDTAEYNAICEKRKAAGARGGKTKAENQKAANEAKAANGSNCYDDYQKPPDTDTDTDTDTDIDISNKATKVASCAAHTAAVTAGAPATPEKAPAQRVNSSDFDLVIDAWNSTAALYAGIANVKGLNNKRKQLLGARIKEHGVNAVLDAIGKIQYSDFLQGKGKKGWVISFDWFILPANFIKVYEGNYDNKGGNQAMDNLRTVMQLFDDEE